MTACPSCQGAQLVDHPAGWLVFQHVNGCSLGRAEDARTVADLDVSGGGGWGFVRPATATEEALLSALGHSLPTDLTTEVTYLTASVRRRRWPALDTTP